jgi:hypothetical protein
MQNKEQKFPKKSKLITDGGFYMIIKNDGFVPRIHIPLIKKIRVCSPETGDINMPLTLDIVFYFSRVYRGYAEYKQEDVVSIIK